jgi:HAD superfamily hydrolase (TIGR01549 family)
MPKPFVMFDVEGTLVDCAHETLACCSRTFRQFGFEFSAAELHPHSGRDPDDMIRALLAPREAERLSSSLKQAQGKRYREEYLPKVAAFPGVRDLFEAALAADYATALVTTCDKEELGHYLKLTGIADLVDVVACGEDVDRGKPHPDLISLALERAHHPSPRSFMVGDTPYDAQAATAAGVSAIGVLCGGFRKSELLQAGCSVVYRDPAHLHRDLFAWIERSIAPGDRAQFA